MSPFAKRVRAAIRQRRLIGAGDRTVIALSGGADSVALTLLLRELAAAGDLEIAGLVHVHHGLRGAEADADEQFCRALAARLDWPIDVVHVDTRAEARGRRVSIETAARTLRYRAFSAAAARLNATLVVTAHTADDQAETILMRLLRGAGTRGLAGIRRRRGAAVRPLLDWRRQDLRRYLAVSGQSFCEDQSNADVSIARNRMRAELMPVIERLVPSGIRALSRLADHAADDEAYLEVEANRAAPAASKQIDVHTLRQLPPALSRRVVRRVAAVAAPEVTLSARHLDAVLALARSSRDVGRLDLPGICVQRRATWLQFDGARPAPPALRPFAHVLDVPGRLDVPETGDTITAVTEVSAGPTYATTDRRRAVLQRSALATPLLVRNRRPGDRLQPLGAPGRKKLQDLFVDRKIPRELRDRVPIVEDARGRIVWVAGVAVDEAFRVTAPEAGVVILDLKDVKRT